VVGRRCPVIVDAVHSGDVGRAWPAFGVFELTPMIRSGGRPARQGVSIQHCAGGACNPTISPGVGKGPRNPEFGVALRSQSPPDF
jgi:hypothetical protein